MKIFFAPHYPEPLSYLQTVVLYHLEYQVTLDPEDDFDAACLWADQTFITPPEVLQSIAKSKPVINLRCTDISKSRVEEVFTQVFGYSSLVDPREYRGLAIQKSDLNCDGNVIVVECPLDNPEEDHVYQKFIDSRRDGYQREYRTPVIFGQLPMVYVSKRDFPAPGDNAKRVKRHSFIPTPPEQVYSQEEIQQIIAFCAEMGMDLGELDILRDREDGRLYILDANNTPAGYGLLNRPNWAPGDRARMVEVMAQAFEMGLKRSIEALRS